MQSYYPLKEFQLDLKWEDVMQIEKVTGVTDELIAAFSRLGPQLSETFHLPSRREWEEIVTSPAITLLIARSGDGPGQDDIIGTLTLVVFRSPAGVSAHIEDVVVDQSARGKGVGEALTRTALTLAAEKGAKKVDLTSSPWREAANRLYQRLGFVHWNTNFYRYVIEK